MKLGGSKYGAPAKQPGWTMGEYLKARRAHAMANGRCYECCKRKVEDRLNVHGNKVKRCAFCLKKKAKRQAGNRKRWLAQGRCVDCGREVQKVRPDGTQRLARERSCLGCRPLVDSSHSRRLVNSHLRKKDAHGDALCEVGQCRKRPAHLGACYCREHGAAYAARIRRRA